MHEGLQDMLDLHEVLITLARLAQRVLEYTLPALSKFVFIGT